MRLNPKKIKLHSRAFYRFDTKAKVVPLTWLYVSNNLLPANNLILIGMNTLVFKIDNFQLFTMSLSKNSVCSICSQCIALLINHASIDDVNGKE